MYHEYHNYMPVHVRCPQQCRQAPQAGKARLQKHVRSLRYLRTQPIPHTCMQSAGLTYIVHADGCRRVLVCAPRTCISFPSAVESTKHQHDCFSLSMGRDWIAGHCDGQGMTGDLRNSDSLIQHIVCFSGCKRGPGGPRLLGNSGPRLLCTVSLNEGWPKAA